MGSPAQPDSNPAKPGSTGGGNPAGGGGGVGYMPPMTPFAPDTPYTYVSKVKNILIGLPATDDEVSAVANDPTAKTTANALQGLIQQWMQKKDPNNAEGLTYYQEKMIVFFKLAFQQTQIAATDFGDQFDQGQLQPMKNSSLLQNAEESMARTALALPNFQDTMTTQSFMMTTALKVLYALTDVWQIGDNTNSVTDSFANANKGLKAYVTATNIPLSDTLTVGNKNYMHWYVPGIKCTTDPQEFDARSNLIYDVLTGQFDSKDFPNCSGGTPLLTAGNYSDWQMVTITAPTESHPQTPFYDLADLPTATTLYLNRPYVSFFTTPAFFANWQTNASNEMRVTTNQALIVGLGQYILPDPTTAAMMPANPPGLDSVHAAGQCKECHEFLDPTRSIFAKFFSWNYGYGLQNATFDGDTYADQAGEFAFQTKVEPQTSILEFGQNLANHPLFPGAWVQKLSYYANSQGIVTTDPVYTTIVDQFQKGYTSAGTSWPAYSWAGLVTSLLSSPLTTNVVETTTTEQEGVTVAVARRDHLCAALNFRLGFTDVCQLLPSTPNPKNPYLKTIATIAGGLPSDGYGRGSSIPVLPNQPSLFYRAGTENICENVAQLVIDTPTKDQVPNVQQWSSSDSPTTVAIPAFVQTIMGISQGNPSYNDALGILVAHYNAALEQSGVTATDALQSTFTAACLSPTFVGIGM
jgi:hypothetical protein